MAQVLSPQNKILDCRIDRNRAIARLPSQTPEIAISETRKHNATLRLQGAMEKRERLRFQAEISKPFFLQEFWRFGSGDAKRLAILRLRFLVRCPDPPTLAFF